MVEQKPTVVVIDGGYDSYRTEKELVEAAGGTLVHRHCDNNEAQVIEAVRGATVVLARQSPVTRRVFEAGAGTLRAVIRYGIGFDNVDTEAASEYGVAVANTPGYGSNAVGMHTVGLLLAVMRQIPQQDRGIRNGQFNPSPDPSTMLSLQGQTIGLIGYGDIAQAFHRMLDGFDIGQVLIHTRTARHLPGGAALVELDELFAQSDVVSVHVPLVPGTEHIVNADRLGRMKKTAVLLNTARGGLVDTDALVSALRNRTILGAGLDVFEPEPLPVGHPLLECDNAVLTSHIGWCTLESIANLQRMVGEEAARALRGEPLSHQVN